jgi:hypothetical protein
MREKIYPDTSVSENAQKRFCGTRTKSSVEVYKGKNLHPPPLPAQIVTDVTRKTAQALREIVSKVGCSLCVYKSIKEKLMSL